MFSILALASIITELFVASLIIKVGLSSGPLPSLARLYNLLKKKKCIKLFIANIWSDKNLIKYLFKIEILYVSTLDFFYSICFMNM
jgi:hypothetical protein